MTYMIYKCPMCKAVLDDPAKLREHRLKMHKTP